MNNFSIPLYIEGNNASLKQIAVRLENIGYIPKNFSDENFDACGIVTYYAYHSQHFTNVKQSYNEWEKAGKIERTLVNASDKELVLALASMREGEEFFVGESIISLLTTEDNSSYFEGSLYTVKRNGGANGWIHTVKDSKGSILNALDKKFFRKATAEEIIAHYSSNKSDVVPFPEKWYISNVEWNDAERKFLKSNTSTDNNFNNIVFDGRYYHFHNGVSIDAGIKNHLEGYIKVNPAQFKSYIESKQQTMKQELIGYKLKAGVGVIAATRALEPNAAHQTMCAWNTRVKETGICFQDESSHYYKAKELGILDLLFEPVYKEINTKRSVFIGTNSANITVQKDGKILLPQGQYANINIIKAIVAHVDTIGDGRIIGTSWEVTIDEMARFIRIGCKSENHRVSLVELKNIIDIHKELNK